MRLLFSTIRHLKAGQIGWRLVHEARRRVYRQERGMLGKLWRPDARARVKIPPAAADFLLLAREREVAQRWRDGFVSYLAETAPRTDWTGEGRSRLWQYERQYHSELVALSAVASADPGGPWIEHARALMEQWAAACPAPRGTAWEPYPVARRILNWSLAAMLAPDLADTLAPHLSVAMRFLRSHLEYHLLGNHLICDAAALMSGGAVLDTRASERMGSFGEGLLAKELTRQVLGDGGYAERSPQYHALVLHDVLVGMALQRRRGRVVPSEITQAAQTMARWLEAVTRNSSLPWLNDAAPDATIPVSEVLSLARAVGLEVGSWDGWLGRALGAAAVVPKVAEMKGDVSLPETGWYIAREPGHELLFEHGPIGPDEQPGHGHSDALSFELVWAGRPIVTDTGVTTYDVGPVRNFERSARAHATVTVNGSGPDALWAAFRVGARGRVEGGLSARTPEGVRLLDGRVRAPQGWVHRRRIAYWPGQALVVLDRVSGTRGVVQSHLPLDPSCAPAPEGIRFPGGILGVAVLRGRVAATLDGWVGEGFGRRRPRPSIVFDADGDGCVLYALTAPGRSVHLEGGRCVIHGGPAVVTMETAGLI